MRIILQKHTFLYVMMAVIFCLAVVIAGVSWASRTQASSERQSAGTRLITLHDNGQDKGILTNATTLRDAFKEAKVTIDPNDLVEPGLDSKLVASQYEVNVYRARPITVVDGPVRQKILSPYQTARQVAKHAGITLQSEDTTVLSVNTDMVSQGAGLHLTITRATPFTFVLYGKRIVAHTQAVTVGEMLQQKKITLSVDDTLSVPANTPITAGMTVELWRNGKQVITEDEAIAFPVDQTKDADQPVGYKKVTTPGVDGKRTVSYEVEMRNGVEVSRTEIQSVTTLEPVRQVEIIGAKLPTPTNPTEAQELGRQMMLAYGYGEDQWSCLYHLWMRESGWKTTAGNATSGAYGIPQSLPASKMKSVGDDYLTNPATQITWGLGYIKGRYQTPCKAWDAFNTKGWY